MHAWGETWGETTLGMVTGNNNYFALSPDRARQLGLRREELRPLSPPGSRHRRGLEITSTALAELGRAGACTWLFYPPVEGGPSRAARAYIKAGEAGNVHLAHKCRKRKPRWRVPLVPPGDLLLTYMNADTPRLTRNEARVRHLNSVHGVYLRREVQTLGAELLPLGALNSMTLLGAGSAATGVVRRVNQIGRPRRSLASTCGCRAGQAAPARRAVATASVSDPIHGSPCPGSRMVADSRSSAVRDASACPEWAFDTRDIRRGPVRLL